MKRKLKCYMAFTTRIYRMLGVMLIPCAFWILCMISLWDGHGGLTGAEQPDDGGMFTFCFALSVYVVLYEIFTDYWVLGGCLSDAGKGLRYFRTSCRGAEVMKNIASVDLMRRFLGCMILSATIYVFTGWKTAFVMGLAMYCVIVGVLNGSRHFDGFQRNMWIALLAQAGMWIVNIANAFLVGLAGEKEAVMLAVLAILYCGAALCLSRLMVRRITIRIQGRKD